MNDSNRPGNTDPSLDSSKEPEFQPNQPEVLSARAQGAPELNVNKSVAVDPSSAPGWERATLEKLAFAALNEQKATRRWKTFVRLSWLLCASHGAAYRPDTGQCAAGPCRGGLVKIMLSEREGVVYWHTAYNLQPLLF